MAAVTRRLFVGHSHHHLTRFISPSSLRHHTERWRRWRCGNGNASMGETLAGGESYLITTPLFYVNAAPHMGSAYPTIAADVIARFQRLRGKEVCFLTGTDEHGEKIAAAAKERGLPPKEHCDEMVVLYKELWEQLDIRYDRFIRTTSPGHERFVQEIVDRVWENGDIYLDQYNGHYCIDCEEYKDIDQMDAQHNCLVHQKPCPFRQEENYFFRLSRYQKQIEALLETEATFIQPMTRRNEVLGWVTDGLKDFSISRLAVDWGIPMKQDPKHTIYVWFDALNGYLSGLFPEESEPVFDELRRTTWPANVHLIGKDILRFHAVRGSFTNKRTESAASVCLKVYWPAMLMSAGLPLPKQVFGHGFLTKDGLKMGKSLGNVLEPSVIVSTYGSDAVRYYFMKEIAFGQDGDFSEQRFREVINAAFANDIGNLLNRTLGLLKKNCDGIVSVPSASISPLHPLRNLVVESAPKIAAAYEAFKFTIACDAILSVTSRGNQYLQETTPWTTFKKGTDEERQTAVAVLVSVLETVRIVAVFLSPVAPSLCGRIYQQLGFPNSVYASILWEKDSQWGQLPAGQRTADPDPVFKRLEGDLVIDAPPIPV